MEKYKQIKLRASEEEVIRILGTPDRTRVGDLRGRKVRFLEYDAPAIVATAPYVVIDELSGRTAEVTAMTHIISSPSASIEMMRVMSE